MIFRCYISVLVEQTGISLQRVNAALEALEHGAWIEREGPILWVKKVFRVEPPDSSHYAPSRTEEAARFFSRCYAANRQARESALRHRDLRIT